MSEYIFMTMNLKTDLYRFFQYGSFEQRSGAVNRLIGQYHPDVIGVQELTRHMFPSLSPTLSEYGIFGDSRHALIGDEYNSILYRKDRFDLTGGSTLWLSHHPENRGSRVKKAQFPRIVTIAYLRDRRTDQLFTFFNTHLDQNFPSVRTEQCQILARIVMERSKGSFQVLTGDFNTVSASPALQTLQKTGLRDAVPEDMKSTMRGTVGTKAHHDHAIDHIFLSKELHAEKTQRIEDTYNGTAPSDHYPVLTYVSANKD
jgi:endonuclease/exonuclease/phosphatase family metal-dependent hydrolase